MAKQNVNESLNGMIWQRCPKTGFASKFTVETAVNDAVACLNQRFSAVLAMQSRNRSSFLKKLYNGCYFSFALFRSISPCKSQLKSDNS
jgi:hypothetical protein